MSKITLFWHRRDLRTTDNAGLYRALTQSDNVLPIFIFDKDILDALTDEDDARVSFIHRHVQEVQQAYEKLGSSLIVRYGKPIEVLKALVQEYEVKAVFTNKDYEPYAKLRDQEVEEYLAEQKIDFKRFKDHVIFEKEEVVKDDGDPYRVFTPYKRKWLAKLDVEKSDFYMRTYPVEKYLNKLHQHKKTKVPTLAEMGFKPSSIPFPPKDIDNELLKKYGDNRDFPARKGTSKLGVHLRFGTVSIREVARAAAAKSEVFLIGTGLARFLYYAALALSATAAAAA